MAIYPYLNFNGHCEEAIDFYTNAIGAKTLMLMRFKDAPDQSCVAPGTSEKVMHATLEISDTVVMFSDAQCQGSLNFEGISLSVNVDTKQEGQSIFDALAAGGQVEMPFSETFWASGFGMLRDKFGVSWMVNVEDEPD